MGVYNPYISTAGIEKSNEEIVSLLNVIVSKLNQNQNSLSVSKQTSANGMVINQKGHMIWWTKNEEASLYRLHLYINDDEIDIIEIDRTKAYHSFFDLVGDGMYKVCLEVINRERKIIDFVSITM